MSPFGMKQLILSMIFRAGLTLCDLENGKKAKGLNLAFHLMEHHGFTVESLKRDDEPEPDPMPEDYKELVGAVPSPDREVEMVMMKENPFIHLPFIEEELPPDEYSSESELVEVDDDDDDDDYDDINDCEIKKKDDDDGAAAAAAAGEDKQQMDDGVPPVSNKLPRHAPTTGADGGDKQQMDDDGASPVPSKRPRVF